MLRLRSPALLLYVFLKGAQYKPEFRGLDTFGLQERACKLHLDRG